ncbi:MAG: response regulator [Phenylobacterium sp.]|uniref:response regulator n=1 Tax=Phenylobacterium sp. TaxID=1871053 RepID=UPI0027350A98|nr:response regulator [Phenylobacterium sp.]MDP1643574.1 response regulator [Phenylobacterium sp.]MDP3118484.1 response regulator [Phenylobacterium sp.]
MGTPADHIDGSAADGEQISTGQLAALSHEFRTPLSGVLGMARLLEGTRLSAEQRAYVSAMRDSGEHLLGLVNELLDFARLGAGKVELRAAPVPVEELLRAVCELLSPRAHEKGLEIAWASPDAEAVLLADESRLRQILLNFAGNAVKFTAKGGVLLGAAPAGEGRWRFTVTDTGPGVSQAARDLIFEAFAQSDPSHQLTGSGLGLAIARRLALAMGGEVGVETAAHGGAVFWFEAPFETLAGPTAVPSRPLAGLRVGIASPNLVVREAASQQVLACGGTPVVAAQVEELLPLTGPHDVLLLDHALGQGGRKVRRPFDRPALILLAPEERDRIARYRASGFCGYLIKPLRRASLAERVLAALQSASDQAPAPDDDRVAPAAAPGARVLLVEDNPVNALLARTLLGREGCSIDHALTGHEALAALQVGAYDLVLMDMRLPDITGEETTRRLRAAGVETPVVALTANAFQEDREACMAAGMNDFLVKPLAVEALRIVLSRWARRSLDAPVWTEAAGRAKVG